MLRRIVQFFAAKTYITLPIWIAALAAGAIAYTSLLPRDGFPSVEVPIAIASGGYFVDDQELIDRDVAQPISETLLARDEIVSVTTNSRDNSFVAIVSLGEAVTSSEGAELIRSEIETVALPDEVQWDVSALNAAQFLERFDLLVGVQGPPDATAEELEAAAAAILPAFEGRADIEDAEVVELISRGINPATGEPVAQESDFNQFTAETDGGLELLPMVTVGVVAADGVDALAIRDAVDDVLIDVEIDELLADDYQSFVAIDFATQIRQQVGSLQSNVITGIIAVTIIALLLISWRASTITAVFLVTVLAVSFLLFYAFGISINTISLFGVILALGLFVDDSIVITEAIDAFREGGKDPIEIIGHAIKRVGAAKISGTITTVLVFAPMLAISGILGDFIRILPISVIIALVSSLVLALVFIPFAARFIILSGERSEGPLARAEDKAAEWVASLPATEGRRGLTISVLGFLLSLAMIGVGLFVFAPLVGFNIFPPSKDSEAIAVEYTFEPGTSIEEAKALTLSVNEQAVELLGDDVVSVYTFQGNSRNAFVQMQLSELGSRDPAPQLVEEKLDPLAETVDGARVVFNQISAGPPEALFPFQVQIFGDDADVLAIAGEDIAATLEGASIERPNGTSFTVLETDVALTDMVSRQDGRRLIEVRARFDGTDTTTTVSETQSFLEAQYGPNELAALGLEDDALGFDFGLESDNQESFNSMPLAFGIALIGMLLLLIIQFRSTVQWLLVFLAIPFSFFGVFGGLLLTDNVISFFVMLGLLGLIGIAVNNTILLTDFANQERRAGATRKQAIETALRRRFRPLVATSLTTVAGVLPLALSDPFWEALGFTIIFGLLSSTFLVLISFPYYYLALETVRDKVVTPWRPKEMRPGGGSSSIDGPVESVDLPEPELSGI